MTHRRQLVFCLVASGLLSAITLLPWGPLEIFELKTLELNDRVFVSLLDGLVPRIATSLLRQPALLIDDRPCHDANGEAGKQQHYREQKQLSVTEPAHVVPPETGRS